MKRIIVPLVVATLMLAMSTLPASAANFGKDGGGLASFPLRRRVGHTGAPQGEGRARR